MRNRKLRRYLFLVGLCVEISGIEIDFGSTNTYLGQEITAANILQLSPDVPQDLQKQVEIFLISHWSETKDLSGGQFHDALTDMAYNFNNQTVQHLMQVMASVDQRNKVLKEQGMNKSDFNYVIPILNNQWFIKASGRINRLSNIMHQTGGNLPQVTFQILGERFRMFQASCPSVTYQTIGRMAVWLRAKEAIEKLGLTHIALPAMYLVHIPGRPCDVNDLNYIILEENIKGQSLIESDMLKNEEVVDEFTQLIGYTALWDINFNNFTVKNNKLYPLDFEQRNVERPSDFFHKDKKIYYSVVAQGWGELENNIIRPYATKHSIDVHGLLGRKNLLQESIRQSWLE